MKQVNRKPRQVDEIVSENLRRLRSLSGLSQADLGQRLGVTTQQIQKYERASNRLTAGALVEIAATLGVDVADLFHGCRSADKRDESNLSANQLAVAISFGKIRDPKTRRLVSALIRVLVADRTEAQFEASNPE
jgi:transcriptional regulator with XRE-family HTH domain